MNISVIACCATNVLVPQSLPKGGDRFAEGTVRSHGEGALWKRTRVAHFGHLARVRERARIRGGAQHERRRPTNPCDSVCPSKRPKLYHNPVIISLPPNVDEPSKSSFVRNTSKYCVRFPLREHN